MGSLWCEGDGFFDASVGDEDASADVLCVEG